MLGRTSTRVALRSATAKTIGRWVVIGAATSAFLLAIIGLRQWDTARPEIALSAGALVAGALGLFGVGGVPPLRIDDTVPLAWDAARLLAPLATAGAVVGVAVTLGEDRLHRFAARHASGHVLLVGPTPRVIGYLDALAPDVAVHAAGVGAPIPTGVVRVPVDPSIEGWGTLAVSDAQTIVVATGDDARNVALCADVWDLLAEHPHLDALVEIDDREMAVRLAVALVVDDPHRRLDVICRSDIVVARALDLMVAGGGEERTVVVAGDGPLVEPVTRAVANALWTEMQSSGIRRRRVATLLVGDGSSAAPSALLEDAATFDTRACQSLEDLLVWEAGPVATFVEFDDPAATMRLALALNDERPGSLVCVPSDGAQLPLGLVPLDRDAAARTGRSGGIWARTAIDLWPGSFDLDTDRDAVLAQVDRIRQAVASLATSNRWTIVPSVGSGAGEALLAAEDLHGLGLPVELRELPMALERSGLTVDRVDRRAGPRPTEGLAPTVLDDSLVEEIAQRIHGAYRENRGTGGGDLPANRPWVELSEPQRALNRQQCRQNLVRIAQLGLRVLDGDGDTADADVVHKFDEVVVERLARDEHDRWSRQRHAQGYRWGSDRCDDCSPKTHPDLMAWEDLEEGVRDKDREPIRQIIPGLESVGLRVVVSDQPASGCEQERREAP